MAKQAMKRVQQKRERRNLARKVKRFFITRFYPISQTRIIKALKNEKLTKVERRTLTKLLKDKRLAPLDF